MKTTIFLLAMVFAFGFCNANSREKMEFKELKVQTYLTKTQLGSNSLNVAVYNDEEFKEICKLVDRKKSKKLGEKVFSDIWSKAEYLTDEEDKFGFNKVCCRVKGYNPENNKINLEFNVNCTPNAPSEGNYKISYLVKEGYNYGISIKFEKKHNILFFISPNELENLAKIENWEKH